MNEMPLLAPLPYHREVRDYLKLHEAELWQWFASARAKENYADELKLKLLKSTYRLSPEAHGELYAHATAAAKALGLELPLTLYQAQGDTSQANACIYFLPTEAHIVLSGPILQLLSPGELKSILGHELAHHHLWRAESDEYLIADRVLHAVIADPRAHRSHHETARQYRLHTEIFADRGAFTVTRDLPGVVAALVKTMTGLSTVDGGSYLAQAQEIVSKGKLRSEGVTHPEAFIRAHALALWTQEGDAADAPIRELVAGELTLDTLDLPAQQQACALTRRFLEQLLRPAWFRTDAVLGHAKLFFPEIQPAAAEDPTLVNDVLTAGALVNDYFAFLLLDFVHADPELGEAPLAQALRWAETLGIAAPFEKRLSKELGVKARELAKLKPRIAEVLAAAERGT